MYAVLAQEETRSLVGLRPAARSCTLDSDSHSSQTATQTARPSPKNGNRLPLGAHPGNTGGKKGRSGPKSLDFYVQCQGAVDNHVLPKVIAVVKERSPVGKKGQPDGAYWAAANFLAKYARSPAMPSMQLSQESGKVTVTLDLGEQ